MACTIERIDSSNYNRLEDMIFWREHGIERVSTSTVLSPEIKKELENTNLYVYGVCIDHKYVGWISLIYLPKVGKWNGHGHIYVDELWIEPTYRRKGLAKLLLKKADELKEELAATGVRLYVNMNNPNAYQLYETFGFKEDGKAIFMAK